MIEVSFNQETGILSANYIGDVSLKQIRDYIIATKENKSYPRDLKILSYGTEANFNVLPNELGLIVEENNKSLEVYDSIIDAIVLSGPKETALSMLYQELAKNRKYRFQIFSSREAAEKWLEII
jgi:hypothetical protein